MTRFLGKEYGGALSADDLDAARLGAMAQAEMKYDPVAGMKMRREAAAQQRDTKRFGWEEQAQPLKQRGLELGASAGERLERKGQAEDAADEIIKSSIKEYTGAPEQIESTARYLNQNSARISMGSPDAKGFVRISVVAADGTADFIKLTRQDQAQLYAAGRLLEINPTKALEMMGGVNKNLAAAIAQENGLVGQLTNNANDVAYKGGQLGVAQQNANTNEAYRLQMGAAAGARAAGGSGGVGGGRPVKMDVETLDPVTGKKTKVQVLLDPRTGEAATADGRPFRDSAALDRAMGRMDQDARMSAAEANDLQLVESAFKSNQLIPQRGESPMAALEAARAEVRQRYAVKRGHIAFADLGADEKAQTVRDMAKSSGKKPEEIAALVGADPEFVRNAVKGSKTTKGGLPPLMTSAPSQKSELQQAYDDWMAAKPGFLSLPTPTSAQRERDAEARYTELLRSQYSK
jgi:hypothetical protein